MVEGSRMVIKEKVIQQDMYYKNQLILRYTIKYPKFISQAYRSLANKLSAFYRTKAVMYERSNVMNLYQMAMVEYEYSVAHSYPVHQFEAYVTYEVTYNQNCVISLYFDQYEYTGGAHGITVRTSDTWDLQKSRRMDLSDFFPNRDNYKEDIIKYITKQIENQMTSGNAMYFNDYEELVKTSFKTNNFYLTPDGLVIYFQHYDIAPYSSGIPTFTIPFGPGGAIQPRC